MTISEEKRAWEAGVSATAVIVAAARAIETNHQDSLVSDVYAEHFVRAAPNSATFPLRIEDVPDGDDDAVWGRLGRYFGLRTRVFDDYLAGAAAAGVRQFVLLGAGLDSRAMRLPWPAQSEVYEIDQADMIAFKIRVLDGLGAVPAARVHRVSADLREDWFGMLREAGFSPKQPTAWLAEGLLPYLPAATETALFDVIDAHSAPGSRVAFEFMSDQHTERIRDDGIYRDTQVKMGVHLSGLFDADPRPDSVGRLGSAGWQMEDKSVFEFTAEYGRGPEADIVDAIASARWVIGAKRA
jgi:methyltransferase (TIGR00027 family)